MVCHDHLQVTLPDGTLPRWGHSVTAITVCPGLEDVIMFGGRTDEYVPNKLMKDFHRIAETTIMTFGELCYVPSCLDHLICLCVCSTVMKLICNVCP